MGGGSIELMGGRWRTLWRNKFTITGVCEMRNLDPYLLAARNFQFADADLLAKFAWKCS